MSGRAIDPDRMFSQTSSRAQGPSTAYGQALHAKLINKGTDKNVLAVLETKLLVGLDTITLLDTVGAANFRPSISGQPGYDVVQAVDKALGDRRLSLDQKTKLFSILGWEFQCFGCSEVKKPSEFKSTSFILWGSHAPARPHLRSGPCAACQAQAARNGNGGEVITYSVTYPN